MFLSPFRLGRCRGISLIALLTVAVFAQAQPQGAPARNERADPLDAQVRVPAVTHSSALSSYRRLGDDKRIDWKEANEAVNRIGGWRALGASPVRSPRFSRSVSSSPAAGSCTSSSASGGTIESRVSAGNSPLLPMICRCRTCPTSSARSSGRHGGDRRQRCSRRCFGRRAPPCGRPHSDSSVARWRGFSLP